VKGFNKRLSVNIKKDRTTPLTESFLNWDRAGTR
jgi:hypothetical protein